jgi:RNA polymerase sigma-70 factor (ECF subfamily)
MSEALDDFATLLARGRDGDREALTKLAERYESKIRLVARARLGPALRPYLDSMDLVQSVHRTLMTGLREGKFHISSPEKLVALALVMVRRKVAHHWRRFRRELRTPAGREGPAQLATLLASLVSPAQDPASALQFTEAVQRLCDTLSATEQRVLELQLEGYRPGEIAATLGLNSVALRVRLLRLRQRLRASGLFNDWL